MTISEQLHRSATHKKGIDPACPKCVGDQVQNLIEAVEEIYDHIRTVRAIRDQGGWLKSHPAERKKLLMELRHDLQDALKSVAALEEGIE
jgi:uncharacterized protein YdeI (YjbR/CyaY-like superfamily)